MFVIDEVADLVKPPAGEVLGTEPWKAEVGEAGDPSSVAVSEEERGRPFVNVVVGAFSRNWTCVGKKAKDKD